MLKITLRIIALVAVFLLGTRYYSVVDKKLGAYIASKGYLLGCVEARVELVGKKYGENYLHCLKKSWYIYNEMNKIGEKNEI
jgi:hypothetical protein